MKTKWEVRYFSKKIYLQFNLFFFDSESNGGVFYSLAPFGGALWRFKNLKFVKQLQPTQKNFF